MTPAKRALDVFLSLVLGAVLLPAIGLIAIAILLREGRPVFFVAERMKTPAEPFNLWKFRTMTTVSQDTGVSGGDKATRITPTGQWLRGRRLDELPQLWNILRGDLSFVGPRPPLREYVERFPVVYARVLRSRPGVTGLASLVFHKHEETMLARCSTPKETDAVYARNCVPRKARLDLIYQHRASVCFDIAIIWKTATGVFTRTG